jgi:hypothetical protein
MLELQLSFIRQNKFKKRKNLPYTPTIISLPLQAIKNTNFYPFQNHTHSPPRVLKILSPYRKESLKKHFPENRG